MKPLIKSRTRLFVPLPALISAAAMLAGPSAQCADDLCAYWPLDENSGTVVPNNSASAAANLYNGASWVAGTINNALSFNGYNQFVTGAVTVPLTDTAVTMWFRTSQAGGGLYSATTQDGSSHDRHIYLDGGNIHSRLWSEETISSTGKNYADGQWHQVVHTFGGAAGGQKLYVDGELVASGSKTSSDFNWQTHVQLGYSISSPTHFFNGQLDDVRIWNRALTAAEAQALAQRSGTANYPNPPSVGIIGGANLKLDWLAPTGAASHDIYLSGSPDVANSTPASEDFMGNFTTKPLDVEDAIPGYYYWRVDERLDTTLFKGPVWSFQYLGTTGSNSINFPQPTTWWVGANESFLQSGVLSGSGTFCKDGSGTLILTGNNTNSGGTIIRDGILQIGNGGTSGSLGSGPVTVNSTLAFNRSDNFTFSGALNGPGNVTQNGPGGLNLLGAGITYSGNTILNGGSLTIAANPNFNSAIQINAGQLVFDTTSNYIVAPKVISGTGPLIINGNSTNWTHFTADNTYTGGTIINPGGLLLLGMNTPAGSVLGNITDNGTLGLYHSSAWTFSNNVSGTGAVNIYSPSGNPVTISGNTVSLGNLNAFHNPGGILTNTTVNLAGSINIFPDSTLTVGPGADINVAGGMTQGGNAYNGTMSTLKVTGGNLTFGDQINDGWDGSYSILQTGGTVTAPGITGGNGGGTWPTNTITLEGGTLVLGASGINGPCYKWPWFPNGGGLTMNVKLGGGTLSANASWSSPWGANLTGTNGNLTVNPAGHTITLGGAVVGSGGLNLTGSGTLILAANNSYSGSTTVGAATTFGGAGGMTGPVTNNGTLSPGNNAPGKFTVNNTLTLAPDSSITWQVSDWFGAPGIGYDSISANLLNLTATSADPVVIRISSQSLTHFSEAEKVFTLIQSTGSIAATWDPAKLILDTSAFTAGQGTWSIRKTGDTLELVYGNYTDTDGDGTPDWQERDYYHTNPNVANTITSTNYASIQPHNYSGATGHWSRDDSGTLTALERRGEVSFPFTVEAGDSGIFEIVLTGGAAGSPRPAEYLPLVFSIDTTRFGSAALPSLNGGSATATVLTPWIQPGTHTLTVLHDNYRGDIQLRIESIQIRKITGLQQRITSENQLTRIPTSSLTSPVCVEGITSHFPGLALTAAGNPAPATVSVDSSFFANVPLSETSATTLNASFQSGASNEIHAITWAATNLYQYTALDIRQGDSLRLDALTGGSPSGTFTVTLDGTLLADGQANTTHTSGQPFAATFNSSGTHTLVATLSGQSPHTITLHVHSANFGPAYSVRANYYRDWTPTSLSSAFVIQPDSHISWQEITSGSNPRRFRVTPHEAVNRHVLARLPDTVTGAPGAILARGTVNAYYLASIDETADPTVVTTYPDGTVLMSGTFVAVNLPSDIRILLTTLYQGTVFANGSNTMWLSAADFDQNGIATVYYERAGGGAGYMCTYVGLYVMPPTP